MSGKLPHWSSYVGFNDNPILFIDPSGQVSVNSGGGPGDPPPTNSQGSVIGTEKDPVRLDEVVITFDRCLYMLEKDIKAAWGTYEGLKDMVEGTIPIDLVFTGATDKIKQDFVMKTITIISDYMVCKDPDFSILEAVHNILDVLSFIPLFGDIADLANGVLYAAEGDEVAASASLLAVIFGSSGATVPIVKKIEGEIIEEAEEKIVKEIAQGAEERSIRKRNEHLADDVHPEIGVPFDSNGFPDFSDHLYKKGPNDVTITPTGNRAKDFREANRAAGYAETPEGYTWHHHQDRGRMQLVERNVHRRTGHTGGFTLHK